MNSYLGQFTQIESELVNVINQFTSMIENSPHLADIQDQTIFQHLMYVLMYPQSEPVLLAALKCILSLVKRCPNNCFKVINSGVYQKILPILNPSDSNANITLNVSILARDVIIQMGSYDEILQHPQFNYLKYDLFLDKIFQFPLPEQKEILSITRKMSNTYLYDYYLPSIIQICPLLTHTDIQIVSDSIQLLLSYSKKANLNQLKIVDPVITNHISIALELIDDEHLIFFLLTALDKFCRVSYEYAENLINLPIDFGLIIDHLGVDPRADVINTILGIIKRIFSFQTFRKSETRNQKLSNFAFYVQPVLIKILALNSSDMNLALELLLTTFDIYFPFKEINSILDSIVHIISSGNNHLKIDSFYKKIVENSKIKEGINQYESLKLPTQIFIPQINDLNSFNSIQKVHSSTFALSEPLQNSVLLFLKNIDLNNIIEDPSFDQFKESLLKVVEICQKTIVFSTHKPTPKYGSQIINGSSPQLVRFTIYNSSGQLLNLCVPECLNLTITEAFFNYVNLLPNRENAALTHLPRIAVEQVKANVALNRLDKSIEMDLLDDMKIGILNHALCFKSNEMLCISRSVNSLLPTPEISQLNQFINNRLLNYKFYKIKSEGKIYSVYDNLYHIMKQTKTNQFEMIEIPKYNNNIREADFFTRKDIKNYSSISQIKFALFHESFIFAYPTLNLQKRAFDYYQKTPINSIETNLQILKEIHQLFPDLKNDKNENVFENKILAMRLFELISFSNINPATTSAFINYPFVFTLEHRLLFLKITSFSFFHFIFTLANDIFIKSGKPFLPFQRIEIKVNRNNLFNDGLTVFNLFSPGGMSFNIKFEGENALGSGPTQEFFRLFALKMQLNSLDIWLSDKSPSSNTQNNESNNTNESTNSKTNNEIEDCFAEREGELGLFPSPFAVHRPDLFFTLGALCAKSIEMGIVLPLRFSPAFFKLVRGEYIELSEVSARYSSSLNQPNHDGLLDLPFTLPGRPDIELRNGGSSILTDEGNVDLYIELLKRVLTFNVHKDDSIKEKVEKTVDEEEMSPLTPKSSNAWAPSLQKTMSSSLSPNADLSPLSSNNNAAFAAVSSVPQNLNETENSSSKSSNDEDKENGVDIPVEISNFIQKYSFDCCASMFREGFGRVIPWNSMNLFTAEELCLILAGEDDFSIESLNNYIEIGNEFNSDSQLIQWLFEIISNELSTYEKKLFARFVTGSDNFGIFGLKSLNPKLTISKSAKGEDALPSASTCTNSLKIPEYSSKELLKKKLLLALYECNETFYLS